MKTVILIACSLLILPISLAAQKPMKAMADEHKAMTDQEFVDFAAQTDMIEANLGQLAQTAAADQSVKDYAQMLVTDHTKDLQMLQDAASQSPRCTFRRRCRASSTMSKLRKLAARICGVEIDGLMAAEVMRLVPS